MSAQVPAGEDRLWKVAEAARFLNVSPGTLYHMIGAKRVPVIKLSARCVRFDRRSLLDWIQGLAQPAEKLVPNSLKTESTRKQRQSKAQDSTEGANR